MREHGQQPQPKMSTVTRQLDHPNYFWTWPVVLPDLQSTHPKALWDCQALPVALPEQRIESGAPSNQGAALPNQTLEWQHSLQPHSMRGDIRVHLVVPSNIEPAGRPT